LIVAARSLIDAGAAQLEQAGVETPRLDAELLLAAAVGVTRSEVLAGLADADAAARECYEEWIARRARREPLAYITGTQGFCRIELGVDRRVLIPRPETELLVDLIAHEAPRTILDVATGSGAVALALADELPEAQIVACDVSVEALAVARANLERLGFERVEMIESDLLESVTGRFDAIAANLPYVASDELVTLLPEITRYEPQLALAGGDDGLDLVRRLITAAPDHLEPGGTIALEIGFGQATTTLELLTQRGFEATTTHRDLAGIDRVVSARWSA
jgi:release factor glutamine methyltransferase